MSVTETGSVLGIDVGFSSGRRSSAVCRLDWSSSEVIWTVERFRAVEPERSEVIAGTVDGHDLLCVAVDGPLRRGFGLIGRYRTAERLLTRRFQPLIGKPGQSSAPVGKKLNEHANACAQTVLQTGRVAAAMHAVKIDHAAVVEAFPSSFLGLLLDDPQKVPTKRGNRSDKYFRYLTASGELERLILHLLPGRSLKSDLHAITNHDDRAGLICAIVALAVAQRDYTAVGDDDGWIILPPRSFVNDWGWALLEENAEDPSNLQIECPLRQV